MLVEESCKALGSGSGGEGAAAVAQLYKFLHELVQLRDFHLQKLGHVMDPEDTWTQRNKMAQK